MNDDFMFYETYKTSIEKARNLYGDDDAATLCLAIIYFGVRGETREDMRPELRAVLETIKPYILKSREKKEQTAERLKSRYSSRPLQSRVKGKAAKETETTDADELD